MHNLAQPGVLLAAVFTPPILGLVDADVSALAQQVSAVGVMAFFLWRETRANKELKEEIKELQKTIVELLKERRKEND